MYAIANSLTYRITPLLLAGFMLIGCGSNQHADSGSQAATRGLYNWIHTTADADLGFAFYRDIFGFELEHSTFASVTPATPPPAIRTRAQAGSDALVWQLTDTEGSRFRTVFMGMPGIPFGLELSEFMDIDRQTRQANPWDPGTSFLIFAVNDYAEVLRRLAAAETPVVTLNGQTGTAPDILVRDPDGYLVLIRAAEHPASGVEAPLVADISIALTVSDTGTALAFYRDLMGFATASPRALPVSDLATFGLTRGQILQTVTRIPATDIDVLLWEFDLPPDIPVQPFHWRIQDVGAPQFQLQVQDLDKLLARTRAAGYTFLSVGGQPIQRPFGRFVFARDPDSVLVEFVEPSAN